MCIRDSLYHTEIQFHDQSSEDANGWIWSFTQGMPSQSSDEEVIVTFPREEAGTYPVELIVTNLFGCTDTIERTVEIDGVFSVYVPNAFTPNSDRTNDLFLPVIKDTDRRDYDFSVFDRWGTEIFHTAEMEAGWDGTVKGAEPKTDVYTWKLHVRSSVDGISRAFTGKVTVLR